MNYYEHHLGDYIRDTAHLSMLEDAAYRRLLDVYYIRETPLPNDVKQCCKLVRANSRGEREAVTYILSEFFVLEEDGYHQHRADQEIAKAKNRMKTAQENGRRGGRPPKQPGANPEKTQEKPTGFSLGSGSDTDWFDSGSVLETQQKAHHTPYTRYISSTSTSARAREASFPIPLDWRPGPTLAKRARLAGLTLDEHFETDLGDFVSYRQAQGLQKTQAQWEHLLIASLKHAQANRLAKPQTSVQRAGKMGALSPHKDFERRDYTVGINPDGSF